MNIEGKTFINHFRYFSNWMIIFSVSVLLTVSGVFSVANMCFLSSRSVLNYVFWNVFFFDAEWLSRFSYCDCCFFIAHNFCWRTKVQLDATVIILCLIFHIAGYLNEGGFLNLPRFEKFLKKLSKVIIRGKLSRKINLKSNGHKIPLTVSF